MNPCWFIIEDWCWPNTLLAWYCCFAFVSQNSNCRYHFSEIAFLNSVLFSPFFPFFHILGPPELIYFIIIILFYCWQFHFTELGNNIINRNYYVYSLLENSFSMKTWPLVQYLYVWWKKHFDPMCILHKNF